MVTCRWTACGGVLKNTVIRVTGESALECHGGGGEANGLGPWLRIVLDRIKQHLLIKHYKIFQEEIIMKYDALGYDRD